MTLHNGLLRFRSSREFKPTKWNKVITCVGPCLNILNNFVVENVVKVNKNNIRITYKEFKIY